MDTTDKESNRPKKIVWLLLILPIGLAIGTVTSVVQHLKQHEEENSSEAFTVAVPLNLADIKSGMRGSLSLGSRHQRSELGQRNIQSTRRFIESTVSPAGTGLQFIDKKLHNLGEKNSLITYADIKGSNKKALTCVVVELVGESNTGDAARISIAASLMRALSDAKPNHSLRFILTPSSLESAQHLKEIKLSVLQSGETIERLVLLRANDQGSPPSEWVHSMGEKAGQVVDPQTSQQLLTITHAALRHGPADSFSDEHVQSALLAAEQLRHLILSIAH